MDPDEPHRKRAKTSNITGDGYALLQDSDTPSIQFIIRDMVVHLGRKSASFPNIDIHLGDDPAISRIHAKIEFNQLTRFFEIVTYSKNGIKVDGVPVAVGSPPVDLHSRSLLEIGPRRLWFLLPPGSNQRRISESAKIRSKQLHARRFDEVNLRPIIGKRRQFDDIDLDPFAHFEEDEIDWNDGIHAMRWPISVKIPRAPPVPPAVQENGVKDATTAPVANPRKPNTQTKELVLEMPKFTDEQLIRWRKLLPRDGSKHWRRDAVKPPYSYHALTIQALVLNLGQPVPLSTLYNTVEDRFPFYRGTKAYKSCLRHVLSTTPQCLKVSVNPHDSNPSRGAGWLLDPLWTEESVKLAMIKAS